MPGITFQPVKTDAEIATVAALADTIWRAHFIPIVGAPQIEYMLDKFQSAPAIREQLEKGYEYYLAVDGDEPVGYLALVPGEGELQLSKLYLLADRRGRGIGRAMVDFAAARARKLGAATLWLTCNRHNAASLAFYERVGFRNAGTIRIDIGNGFIMDDYRLEIAVPPAD